METSELTGACLFCLKTFTLSNSSFNELEIPYEARVISPTSRLGFGITDSSPTSKLTLVEVDGGDDGCCYDIYTRFLHLSSRYMKLATTTDVFIRAAQDRRNETGEHVQAFCASCKGLVGYVCDLYAELQAVKLRLIWKLEQIEEIMKNGRNRISGKLFKGLLRMLMSQLNVHRRVRVEMFRKAFQLKCKSRGLNSTPKPLVPRGLFPENWKVGYPACKLVMMRLIVVFLLASLLVVKGKPILRLVENPSNNEKAISTGKVRRNRGRPKGSNKDLTVLSQKKIIHIVKKSAVSTESTDNIKSEIVINEDTATVKFECDNEDLVNNVENDAGSDWCEGAASPDMSIGSIEESNSVTADDVEYTPKNDVTTTSVEKVPSQKRWNLRQRKLTSTVNFAEDSDSVSENDDKDDPDAVIEDETIETELEVTEKSAIKPKSGRGWPRVDVPTIPCPKCQKLFLDTRCLSSHLLHIHNSRLTHSCIICGEKFVRWKELRNHRRAVHRKMKCKKGWSKKPRPCSLCPQQFSTLAALATHRREVHKSTGRRPNCKPKKCPICEATFPSIKIMKEHSQKEHGSRPGDNKRGVRLGRPSSGVKKCKTCGEEFPSDLKLRMHRKDTLCRGNSGRVPSGRAKCGKCGEIFPTGQLLLEHRRKEHPSRYLYQRTYRKRKIESGGSIKCTKCDEVFPTGKLMVAHRRKEHPNKVETPQYKKWSRQECPICNRMIIGKKRFENHLEAHENKNRTRRKRNVFYCEVCGKLCFKLETLQSHMTSIHNNKYSCAVCKTECASGKLLRDHLATHEKPEKFFHCMTCFRGFSCKQYFEIHSSIGHRDPRYILCDHDLCNENFETVELLNDHLTTHIVKTNGDAEGNQIYTCKVCNKGFVKKYNFTMHELMHTPHNVGRRGYDCPVEGCQHTVSYLERLLAHYNRVHGLGIMACKCYLCGKAFRATKYYQTHMSMCEEGEGDQSTQNERATSALQPDEQKLFCRNCGEQFANTMTLIEHKKSCQPQSKSNLTKKWEPVKCPEENCDVMRTPTEMRIHLLRKHGKGDRYPCEKCGKLFVDVKSVKSHMFMHEPPRHKCDLCEKMFKKPSLLSYHKLTVHSENRQKDYTCHLCGMSYYSKVGLKFHNFSKHSQDSELPYRCQWCGKGYGRKLLFTLHIKNCGQQHGGGIDEQNNEKPNRKLLKRRRKSSNVDEEEMTDKSTTDEEDEIVEEKTVATQDKATMLPAPVCSAATPQYNIQDQTKITIPFSVQEHHHVNPQMFSNYYSPDFHLAPLPPQRPGTSTALSSDINRR